MIKVVFLYLFVVGYTSGSPIANQYFDSLLNVAIPNEVRLQRLDPADLDNLTVEFEDKVKIIGEMKGKADFFNGNVTGMSKNPKFTGLGPLNRFIKSLEDGFKHRALEILFDDMTGDLQTALGRAVSSLPFPM